MASFIPDESPSLALDVSASASTSGMVLPVPFCFLVSATFPHRSRGLVVAKQNVRISNLVSLRTVSFCPKHGFSIRSS